MKNHLLRVCLFLLSLFAALAVAGNGATSPIPKLYTDLIHADIAGTSARKGAEPIGLKADSVESVGRVRQEKASGHVSVADFGVLDKTGVTDMRSIFQSAVNSVLPSGGVVEIPQGDYLITGVASPDAYRNGVLIPWNSDFNNDKPITIKAIGRVRILSGSNSMVLFRASRTGVRFEGDLILDGNTKTDTVLIGYVPESMTQTTTKVSQSYGYVSAGVLLQNSDEGIWWQPGPRGSGSYFYTVAARSESVKRSYYFKYNADLIPGNPPGTSKVNVTTNIRFNNPIVRNGNVGWDCLAVAGVEIYGVGLEFIHPVAGPYATQTGIVIPAKTTYRSYGTVLSMYGGSLELAAGMIPISNADATTVSYGTTWNRANGGAVRVVDMLPKRSDSVQLLNYEPTGGAFSAITLVNRAYSVTKVGDVVTISGFIRTSAITIGTGAGTVLITGLPYTAKENASVKIGNSSDFVTNRPSSGMIFAGEKYIRLMYRASANGDSLYLPVSDLKTAGNGNIVYFSATYLTAD